ncbi:Uncharacterised protein [Shigella sonnei]|nr:Uncharacterised protein [Shigella sonnei]
MPAANKDDSITSDCSSFTGISGCERQPTSSNNARDTSPKHPFLIVTDLYAPALVPADGHPTSAYGCGKPLVRHGGWYS